MNRTMHDGGRSGGRVHIRRLCRDRTQRSSSDVLERPAMQSPMAAKKLLIEVVRAGERLVAVGPRGHIVVSTDAGATWQQAQVPVSSDLTAVYFSSEKHGWAVGHDGVVLASTDGGMTWTKQLDGRVVNDLVLADLQAKLTANPASAELQALVAEAERYKAQGPDKPFLDVWFENDTHGFVVGAYGLLLETSDGGQTWQSWFDRAENPRFMNLYSIKPAAGALYVSGEGGTVLKLDPVARTLRRGPRGLRGKPVRHRRCRRCGPGLRAARQCLPQHRRRHRAGPRSIAGWLRQSSVGPAMPTAK